MAKAISEPGNERNRSNMSFAEKCKYYNYDPGNSISRTVFSSLHTTEPDHSKSIVTKKQLRFKNSHSGRVIHAW